MKKYTYLFFDLDHTLWDFERNSEETLLHLFEQHKLARFAADGPSFVRKYSEINRELWSQYNMGKINKATLRTARFERTFAAFDIDPAQVTADFGAQYLQICPTKPWLFPYAQEILHALSQQYTLGIITNGFAESQHVKLNAGNIAQYFKAVVISEEIGYHKPDARIFAHALEKLGATPEGSLMIGDSLETDMAGAIAAGIDQVYFNPGKAAHGYQVTYEIGCLSALQDILTEKSVS